MPNGNLLETASTIEGFAPQNTKTCCRWLALSHSVDNSVTQSDHLLPPLPALPLGRRDASTRKNWASQSLMIHTRRNGLGGGDIERTWCSDGQRHTEPNSWAVNTGQRSLPGLNSPARALVSSADLRLAPWPRTVRTFNNCKSPSSFPSVSATFLLFHSTLTERERPRPIKRLLTAIGLW